VLVVGLKTLLIGKKQMENDEIHRKAQAEALYYLAEKEVERKVKRRNIALTLAVFTAISLMLIAITAE
jgi:glutamine phosphoribosylpyrophosphate amidotransferase